MYFDKSIEENLTKIVDGVKNKLDGSKEYEIELSSFEFIFKADSIDDSKKIRIFLHIISLINDYLNAKELWNDFKSDGVKDKKKALSRKVIDKVKKKIYCSEKLLSEINFKSHDRYEIELGVIIIHQIMRWEKIHIEEQKEVLRTFFKLTGAVEPNKDKIKKYLSKIHYLYKIENKSYNIPDFQKLY